MVPLLSISEGRLTSIRFWAGDVVERLFVSYFFPVARSARGCCTWQWVRNADFSLRFAIWGEFAWQLVSPALFQHNFATSTNSSRGKPQPRKHALAQGSSDSMTGRGATSTTINEGSSLISVSHRRWRKLGEPARASLKVRRAEERRLPSISVRMGA